VKLAQARLEERTNVCAYLATKKGVVVDDALIQAIRDREHLGWKRKSGPRHIRAKLNRFHGESLESLIEAATLREFHDLMDRIYLIHQMGKWEHVTRAADELDVDRRVLVKMLERLGIRERAVECTPKKWRRG
jgi:transcriptional regulator with GAF, ATPase, and Fis domain